MTLPDLSIFYGFLMNSSNTFSYFFSKSKSSGDIQQIFSGIFFVHKYLSRIYANEQIA